MNLRALLELMRVSNLPTVWSNVTLGAMTGMAVGRSDGSFTDMYRVTSEMSGHGLVSLVNAVLIALAFALPISVFYCAGMVLNDYWDRQIDANERPSRPIPSGRISPGTALALTCVLFAVGVLYLLPIQFAAMRNPDAGTPHGLASMLATALLIAAILSYNRIHSRTAKSVFLMALCRVLAVLVVALLFAPHPSGPAWWVFVLLPAFFLGVYTFLISVVARREVEPGGFGGPKVVMNMIAAIPLFDAAWLMFMGLWPGWLFCVGCAVLTKLGHRKVAGS